MVWFYRFLINLIFYLNGRYPTATLLTRKPECKTKITHMPMPMAYVLPRESNLVLNSQFFSTLHTTDGTTRAVLRTRPKW